MFIDAFSEYPPKVQQKPAFSCKLPSKYEVCAPSVKKIPHMTASKGQSIGPEEEHEQAFASDTRSRRSAKPISKTRTIIKVGQPLDPAAVRATVLTAVGPSWICRRDDDATYVVASVGGTVDCPHTSTIVTVGDHVWILPDEHATSQGDAAGTIVKVEARQTLLSRKVPGKARREQVLVSNVEQLGIVVAAAQPAYHKRLIDRYLIAADKGDLRPFIVVNKMDLNPEEYVQDVVDDFAAYAQIGIPVVFMSASTDQGMDTLRHELGRASTLLSGPSGVGKSSVINLLTNVRQDVGAISEKYDKGRHTTTAAQVFPMPVGGSIVDSPGIREFAIWELTADELPFYFEEFTPFAEHCRFKPCSHTHEPGCAVKEGVDAGTIDEERYLSYIVLLQGNMDEQER